MSFATSPAHGPARAARGRIEAVAAMLRETATSFDRRGVAERLGRAIAALYAVLDSNLDAPAHHDGLVEATRTLGEAHRMLSGARAPNASAPDTIYGQALGEIGRLHDELRRVGDEIVDLMLARRGDRRGAPVTATLRPFLVSLGVPRLHALARAPAPPPIVLDRASPSRRPKAVQVPPPKPTTLEELRDAAKLPPPSPEPEPAPAPVEGPAPVVEAEEELARRVARDCLEDIAALRGLRHPIPTETWLDQEPFEQRLLDNLDAFVAIGPRALPSVTLYHAEAPAPDPGRAFALALVLGCIDGSDAVDVAITTMKHAGPEELPGFVEALVLASNPAIDTELGALLDLANPALVGVAVDVLGQRGTLPPDAIDRALAFRDPELDAKLARALGSSVPKTRALPVLGRLIETGDDRLFEIAATSLLRRGDGEIRTHLREILRARAPRAAIATTLLALSGRPDDVPILLEGLSAAPTPAVLRALGRHGHVELLGPLVQLLDARDDELVPVVGEVLDFVTRAGLVEVTEEPWTKEAPPDGSPPPTRKVERPIVDRVRWETWLASTGRRLDPKAKLRRGLPFVPSMIVDELAGTTATERRADARDELVIATGVGLRFATTDWVARQRSELGEIRAHVLSLATTPGAWWFGGASITSR